MKLFYATILTLLSVALARPLEPVEEAEIEDASIQEAPVQEASIEEELSVAEMEAMMYEELYESNANDCVGEVEEYEEEIWIFWIFFDAHF